MTPCSISICGRGIRAPFRVSIRWWCAWATACLIIGNLTMTNHPIHMHGHEFVVTGTDGGWVPSTAHWPEVTTDIGVGQMRAIEFVADEPGDWAFIATNRTTHERHGPRRAQMIGVDHRRGEQTSSN